LLSFAIDKIETAPVIDNTVTAPAINGMKNVPASDNTETVSAAIVNSNFLRRQIIIKN